MRTTPPSTRPARSPEEPPAPSAPARTRKKGANAPKTARRIPQSRPAGSKRISKINMTIIFKIIWEKGPQKGSVDVQNGRLGKVRVKRGTGRCQDGGFASSSKESLELLVEVQRADLRPGSERTLVTVRTRDRTFSFFARDVHRECPIFIPAYGVAVSEGDDPRSYAEIEAEIRFRGLQSELDRINSEPEASFDSASRATRTAHAPIWLGLGRDMRIFEMDYRDEEGYWGRVTPRLHGDLLPVPSDPQRTIEFGFAVGRGNACAYDITRRLEHGYLPILRSRVQDGDIVYDLTAFVTLEQKALTSKNIRGTHFLAADGHSRGHMFTEAQQAAFEKLKDHEVHREEETVLCLRIVARNTAKVPRYAFIRGLSCKPPKPYRFDRATGFSRWQDLNAVFGIHRMDGAPMPDEEMVTLLQPGEKRVFEFYVPHQGVPPDRARKVAQFDFDKKLQACRHYWEHKLSALADITLPEKRIEEMIKAGFLHLDLVAYGREPRGTVTPTIGVYAAIGSESSPIVQFMDSMGAHRLAERSLNYFLDKQHEDGFIQNFGNYMLETGPALWSLGEHYRYTRDEKWVRRIKTKLLKSCDFILRWRERNRKQALKGQGYGLLEGKCADPSDPFRSFMLNGYACLGLKRAAEMLEHVDPRESKRLYGEAGGFLKDIRTALGECMGRSPVVPLADGTWIPSAPPWADGTGPEFLHIQSRNCWSHACFMTRDSLLGPLYLVFQEVLDPHEESARFLLQSHQELQCVRNVALSQPYYSRQAIVHLRRGETKAFLQSYYNGMQGLADPQTYSWWEHYFHASPHKTHEEAWFLMQTRWMLWMEADRTLHLLPGIPRAWLAEDRSPCIELSRVATYFGPYSLRVDSHLNHGMGRVEAQLTRNGSPAQTVPEAIDIRLPHPLGQAPTSIQGGTYLPESECVRVDGKSRSATIVLRF